ncbi:MAG: hypothetical protein QOK42_2711 [Frankiaceae bacterium]|jgi:hypothetical protein|nr:hypothetical protein [Frankiaceae bacterium]
MDTRDSRWLVWTGPVFTVLFYAAIFGLEGSTPGEKDSAKSVTAYYNSHQGRGMAEVFLTPLLVLLLVLFVSHVRTLARIAAGGTGSGPTVMVSGAILWGAGMLVGSLLGLALLSSAHHGQDQVAQTVNVMNAAGWVPFIAGIAVTLVGAGMTVLATGLLPRWMGWVAVVAGVISLAGPGGFLGFWVGPIWMLVAGILLARRTTVAPAVA